MAAITSHYLLQTEGVISSLPSTERGYLARWLRDLLSRPPLSDGSAAWAHITLVLQALYNDLLYQVPHEDGEAVWHDLLSAHYGLTTTKETVDAR